MTPQIPTKLSRNQYKFLMFVASGRVDESGQRVSYESFAQSIGVNRSTLYAWQRTIPDFWGQVQKNINEGFTRFLPDVMLAITKKALTGDTNAAKLILAQTGSLQPMPRAELLLEHQHDVSIQLVSYEGGQ